MFLLDIIMNARKRNLIIPEKNKNDKGIDKQ